MIALSDANGAAILAGLIGGAAILGGAVFADWLVRRGKMQADFEDAVFALGMDLPVLAAFLGPTPPSAVRIEFGSPGWEVDQRVRSQLFRIEHICRQRRYRKNAALVKAVDDLLARHFGAVMRLSQKGLPLTLAEQLTLTTGAIQEQMMAPRQPLDALVRHYIDNGLTEPLT